MSTPPPGPISSTAAPGRARGNRPADGRPAVLEVVLAERLRRRRRAARASASAARAGHGASLALGGLAEYRLAAAARGPACSAFSGAAVR